MEVTNESGLTCISVGSLLGTVEGEDDNSMSGISDCLIELETEHDEDKAVPFKSYLDNTASFSELDLQEGLNIGDMTKVTQAVSFPWGNLPSGVSLSHHAITQKFKLLTEEDLRINHCLVNFTEQPHGNYPDVPKAVSAGSHTPERTAFLSSGQKSRTPRTLLRLQEKHRENERVRHHTLIKNMKAVCGRVPGYDENAKETKVVMMQRVVDYICYLEQNIQSLIDEMSLPLDFSAIFLSTKINKSSDESLADENMGYWSKIRKGGEASLSRYIPESLKTNPQQKTSNTACERHERLKLRRQKISSPTIGSSSDPVMPHSSYEMPGSQSSFSSQDSGKPTPSNIPFLEEMAPASASPLPWTVTETYDPFNIQPKEEFLSAEESLGFGPSDDFGVSSSIPIPQMSTASHRLGDGRNTFSDSDDTDEIMKPVNPDRVLQMKAEPPLSHDKLIQLIEMKKESYLDRLPLTQITNHYKKETVGKGRDSKINQESTAPIVDKNLRSDIGRKDADGFVSYVPYMWKFHDIAMTRRQKAAAARVESEKEKENDELPEANKKAKPIKVDLRKTSWMNGFMMFSRINRRTFIDANPGVHTSHISKMMGHTWRNMADEEQQPYKEKAKKYMQYMQKSSEPIELSDRKPAATVTSNENSRVEISEALKPEESAYNSDIVFKETPSLTLEPEFNLQCSGISLPSEDATSPKLKRATGKCGIFRRKCSVSLLKRNKNKTSAKKSPLVAKALENTSPVKIKEELQD